MEPSKPRGISNPASGQNPAVNLLNQQPIDDKAISSAVSARGISSNDRHVSSSQVSSASGVTHLSDPNSSQGLVAITKPYPATHSSHARSSAQGYPIGAGLGSYAWKHGGSYAASSQSPIQTASSTGGHYPLARPQATVRDSASSSTASIDTRSAETQENDQPHSHFEGDDHSDDDNHGDSNDGSGEGHDEKRRKKNAAGKKKAAKGVLSAFS